MGRTPHLVPEGVVLARKSTGNENDPVELECNIAYQEKMVSCAYIVNFLCFLPLEFSSLMTDGRDVF